MGWHVPPAASSQASSPIGALTPTDAIKLQRQRKASSKLATSLSRVTPRRFDV
jgi:hypothetical protein